MTRGTAHGLIAACMGLVACLPVAPALAGPESAAAECELVAKDSPFDLKVAPPGGTAFVVRVAQGEVRARLLEDRVSVAGALRFQTGGARELPVRLSRSLDLPGGLGYVGPDEVLSLAHDKQGLQLTAKLGSVSLGPLPVPCGALELDESGGQRRSRRRERGADKSPAAQRMDALFAGASGTWVGKLSTLRVYAAARDDAPYVELRGSYGDGLRLHGLGSEGAFVRAGLRGSSAAVVGFVKAGDVEPEKPRGGGGVGLMGGGCQDEVQPAADFVGEAEVAAGARIYAEPGRGPWAELSTATRLPVRYRLGATAGEWVRITALPGIEQVLSRPRFGMACIKPIRQAYVRLSEVSIPGLAELRRKGEASRQGPLGASAVAAARKRLGLDSEAVGTLAVHDDLGCYVHKGRLRCFGEVPGTPGSDGAVEVPGMSDVVRVAVGGHAVCVLRAGGAVACMRTDSSDDSNRAPGWEALPALSDSVAISAGSRQLCAVRADGRLSCADDKGQVSDIDGIRDAVAVSVGGWHTCVLRAGGTAACFGENRHGQLGSGDDRPYGVVVEVAALSGLVRVAAGRGHTCAQAASGALYCFGENGSSELAPGGRNLLTPTEVKARGLREIVAGAHFSCGLSGAGVACFGRSVVDEGLGAGGFSYQGSPVELEGLSGARRLAMADSRACAMLASGQVRCWGQRVVRTAVPVRGLTDGGRTVTKLRAGFHSMCAMRDDGSVRCWPSATHEHELGPSPGARDFEVSSGSLCRVEANGQIHCQHGSAPPGADPATLLAIDTSISCAVRGGKLGCVTDQRPLGPAVDMHIEKELQGEVVQVAAAFRRVCAVEKTGRVVCYESPEREAQKPPQVLPGVLDAVEVAVGNGSTCIRRRDGSLGCDSGSGLVPLEPVRDAVSLSLGSTGACAVRRDGTVWCSPFDYGFGRGPRGYKALTPVPGLKDAVEVVVDDGVTCARLKSGGVSCLGRCGGGRCDGNPQPVPIPGT